MNLIELRVGEVRRQYALLADELSDWCQRAEKPAFEKHLSQVIRIATRLNGYLELVPPPAPGVIPDQAGLATLAARLQAAARVWAYFREKFALRAVDWLAPTLKWADELAWSCYKPVRDAAIKARAEAESRALSALVAAGVTDPHELAKRTQKDADDAGTVVAGALKEPPLVTFTTDASPFASARESAVEGLTEQDRQVLDESVRRLPVPVVGVPWSYLDHLPRSVSIAHEVGHAASWDLNLRGAVDAAFAGLAHPPATPGAVPRPVPDERRLGWQAWRHELFADAYGIQCTGTAAVLALADFLAGDPAVLGGQRQGPAFRAHPPDVLRMKVNLALLAAAGADDEGLGAAWEAAYPFHQFAAFEDDIPAVVAALLHTPLPALGGTLSEVLPFGQAQRARVAGLRAGLIANKEIEPFTIFREAMAAVATLYYVDPLAYAGADAERSLLGRVQGLVKPGPRAVRSAAENQSVAAYDRAAGADLITLPE